MKGYVAPDAGVVVRTANKAVFIGDEIFMPVFSMVSLAIAIVGGPVTVVTFGLLGGLLFLPALLCIIIWTVYGLTSYSFGYLGDDDQAYGQAYDAYRKTIGDHTEELAKPLVDKVFEHAQDNHRGGGSSAMRDYKDCKPCMERIALLKELMPSQKAVSSRDDIEQAKLFLQARKELTGA